MSHPSISSSSLAPRPKPWEQQNRSSSPPTTSTQTYTTPLHTSSTSAPSLPDKPGEMTSLATVGANNGITQAQGEEGQNGVLQQQGLAQMNGIGSGVGGTMGYGGGGYGAGGIGGGMYGSGIGGMSSYSSPFSGGYNSSYGGLGGLSSGYGGMGGGYGGYGGMGGGYGGYGGMNGGMNPYGQQPPISMTSALQSSTAPAFALLESLLSTLSSFTHLLESTYVATHSSFFAMAGLADQVGGLKTYLGQVLGAFSLLRLGRGVWRWLMGRSGNGSRGGNGIGGGGGGWVEEWKIGQASGGPRDQGSHPQTNKSNNGGGRPSSKPLILFLVSAVGLPYLMTKLVRLLTRIQQQNPLKQQQLQMSQQAQAQSGMQQGLHHDLPPKGPITFARTIYPFSATEPHELSLKQDEIVAVLQRYEGISGGEDRTTMMTSSINKELGWWRGRTRDGRVGWFPGNYVEILRKREREGASPIPLDTPAHSDGSGKVRVESRTDSVASTQ